MSTKNIIILSLVVVVVAFATGRLSVSKKIEIKEVEKIVYKEKVDQDKKTDEHKKTVIDKKPDGSSTTTITDDTTSDTQTDTQIDVTKTDTKSHIETPMNIGMTLSLLAGVDASNPASGFIYGVSATKPFFGPITVGFSVFTDKHVFLSAGLQF
jgi:ATP-dependent Zn protease